MLQCDDSDCESIISQEKSCTNDYNDYYLISSNDNLIDLSLSTTFASFVGKRKLHGDSVNDKSDDNICCVCGDDSTSSHVTCNNCSSKYHVQCLMREVTEQCPVCRISWDKPKSITTIEQISYVDSRIKWYRTLYKCGETNREKYYEGKKWCDTQKAFIDIHRPLTREDQNAINDILDHQEQLRVKLHSYRHIRKSLMKG